MGATGLGQCELEVTHRKVFTFTLASFSRVQNAQYEPKSNCVMKILNSTIEFQVGKIPKSAQYQQRFTIQWEISKSKFPMESASCFVDTAFAGGATCPAGSFQLLMENSVNWKTQPVLVDVLLNRWSKSTEDHRVGAGFCRALSGSCHRIGPVVSSFNPSYLEGYHLSGAGNRKTSPIDLKF